jgi:hypothetical protein
MGSLSAQTDSFIIYSLEKCIERVDSYYQECNICHQVPKTIYWSKLISIDEQKMEWEFVFVQTHRNRMLMIDNFNVVNVLYKDDYLLLLDDSGLLCNETNDIIIDTSLLYTDDSDWHKENTTIFIMPIVIWYKVKYSEKEGFKTRLEWRKPFIDFPKRLQAFDFRTTGNVALLNELRYETKRGEVKYFYDEHKFSITPFYEKKDLHIDCFRIFQTYNYECDKIPKRLFRKNGRITTSNCLDITAKRVKFVEKYKFK